MIESISLSPTCTLQLRKKKHSLHKNSFEAAVIEAVDEGLALFGQSSKQAIYFHLKTAFKIKKQEIPFKIEEFADAIEQIFGAGAKLIEIRIIEALHERFQNFVHFPKKGDLMFTEYVDNLHAFLRFQSY